MLPSWAVVLLAIFGPLVGAGAVILSSYLQGRRESNRLRDEREERRQERLDGRRERFASGIVDVDGIVSFARSADLSLGPKEYLEEQLWGVDTRLRDEIVPSLMRLCVAADDQALEKATTDMLSAVWDLLGMTNAKVQARGSGATPDQIQRVDDRVEEKALVVEERIEKVRAELSGGS